MKEIVMNLTGLNDAKKTTRYHIAAILMGFASLALPWWSFMLFVEGKLGSTFNLFLWGVIKTGFLHAPLSFEWWSYTTFVLVTIGAFLGLGGYWLLVRGKKTGKTLIAFEGIYTIAGCLLYLWNLLFTFASFQDIWWTVSSLNDLPVTIPTLYAFNLRRVDGVAAFEFLSIGFFFAVAASALSLIALYKIRKIPKELPV